VSDGVIQLDVRPPTSGRLLAAWERRVDWPLTGLAVVFLAAYAWQVLDTSAAASTRTALEVVLWLVWGAFATDLIVRFGLAGDKRRFLVANLLDIVVVVLPMFRPLRVLRLVTVLKVLNRTTSVSARGKVGLHVSAVTALVGVSASLAVLDAERRDPEAIITTFPDALWWTLTTITTVGYGDRYPITFEGRLIAAGLMIAGIALLGVLTGAIASWFVERMHGIETAVEAVTREEVRELRAELAALRAELSKSRTDQDRETLP
jgi:voltage-gated potassium channel